MLRTDDYAILLGNSVALQAVVVELVKAQSQDVQKSIVEMLLKLADRHEGAVKAYPEAIFETAEALLDAMGHPACQARAVPEMRLARRA